MNDEVAFLRAMQEQPGDESVRLVFADWLEERGDPRGELLRLLNTLTQSVEVPDRRQLEDRLRSLVASGVQPVGPFWTNSIGMKFAWIPAGTFLMGGPENEERGEAYRGDEIQHKVTLTKGFCLAIYPVTQATWRAVMGNNPSDHQGDDLPVELVSWDDCQDFLGRLSNRDGGSYQLPTEAEWEYACRAGTTTPFFFGDTISTDQANWLGRHPYGNSNKGVSREKMTPVGKFPPNPWGLYDMHGNVCEWCADWYGEYPKREVIDPQGPENGEFRVLRGGACLSAAISVRSAQRFADLPTNRFTSFGLRPTKICGG
jgi:formylglycine-generating enzyme